MKVNRLFVVGVGKIFLINAHPVFIGLIATAGVLRIGTKYATIRYCDISLIQWSIVDCFNLKVGYFWSDSEEDYCKDDQFVHLEIIYHLFRVLQLIGATVIISLISQNLDRGWGTGNIKLVTYLQSLKADKRININISFWKIYFFLESLPIFE